MRVWTVGFACLVLVACLVTILWWTYDSGYHRGWIDHAEGRVHYQAWAAVQSLDTIPTWLNAGERVFTAEWGRKQL